MTAGPVRDVGHLPAFAFGHRMPIWWGTLGFMVIEGAGFLVAVSAYFYILTQNPDWPLSNPPPRLTWGTALLGLFLLSELPNQWIKRRAKQFDRRACRIGILLMSVIGVAALALRAMEFTTLECRWDTNAYGSVVWALIFLHTIHIVTDVGETIVIAAMVLFGPMDARRYVDVDENAEYWDFVVLSWIPLYGVLYWAPRWLAT